MIEATASFSPVLYADRERLITDTRISIAIRTAAYRELAVPIFESGKLVYDLPSTEQIRDYCKEQLDTLWQEVQRFENPHTYYVDLSDKLWTLKQELIEGHKDF